MSDNPIWVYDPHSFTVCDEYVYSLLATLDSFARELHSCWLEMATPPSAPSTFDIPLRPVVDMSQARRELGRTLDDLHWLRSALLAFAKDTAEQERARAVAWSEPAERALSMWVSLLAGSQTTGSQGVDPVGHAARAIAGEDSQEHSVVVTESDTGTTMALAPRSLGDRVSRIPGTENPIRVERYRDTEGQWSSEVYIAGTHDWGFGGTLEPFDMESNIALVAGLPAASLASVHLAMKQAGVERGERVTFTGHSQGGVIAARLAESGRYRTTGLVVVGAPTGTLTVTGSYPALALRHRDDIVPRLGGSDQGSGFTTLERGSASVAGDLKGAHLKSGYVEMARDVDLSPASRQLPEYPQPEGTARVRTFRARRAGD